MISLYVESKIGHKRIYLRNRNRLTDIENRNGLDLTETEILRRGGKNTWKNYAKKIFTTQVITMV